MKNEILRINNNSKTSLKSIVRMVLSLNVSKVYVHGYGLSWWISEALKKAGLLVEHVHSAQSSDVIISSST